MRWPHRCRGRITKVEYFEPGRLNDTYIGWGDWVRYGSLGCTLVHVVCSRCGDAFTNKYEGDRRDLTPTT